MNGEADINEAWHIDTLDSRGGMAFASFRAADLTTARSADGPAAFIGAPDFRPESVSSRAVGLAASRGASQIGLFLEDAEVGFETLATVVEFVRRCYLRGAGGDGTDSGGAGLPVPPGEGPRPDLPEQPDLPSADSATGVSTLLDEIGQFEENSKKLGFYADKPVQPVSSPWNRKEGAGSYVDMKTATGGVEALLRAALTLISEMLRRYPVSGSDEDIVQWHSGAQSLGSAFYRLGLWPFFLEGPYADFISVQWLRLVVCPRRFVNRN